MFCTVYTKEMSDSNSEFGEQLALHNNPLRKGIVADAKGASRFMYGTITAATT
jgi:hypothetical protein